MPNPMAQRKNAKRRAARSGTKWVMKSQAAAIKAKAAATRARWKTAIKGRLVRAAM